MTTTPIVYSYTAEIIVPLPRGNAGFGQYSEALQALNDALNWQPPDGPDPDNVVLEAHRALARAPRATITIDVHADGTKTIRGLG